ncbi:multidrug transporter subunit MdtD [Brachymonas chironomi]|uniref:multidrug transporter subunit MdtD n=1 Tax=Brachymonas chironomi TaxID=491919 RepID=UPI0003677952|nr:multidrug transporter subunit MdtD [Brachymonas chironomi]
MNQNPSAPAPADDRSLRILLWLVAVGFFMQTLDGTIVNTALPAMARDLNESPLRMQSVIVAYSLTMATLIPISGWLADRFGTRRIYMGAILVFVLGSLLCGMAGSLRELVLARVVQGAGGALLLPVGRLSVLRAYPKEQFLAAMSFVAIPGLIGPLIGPTLGGWLTEAASWHWVFLVNVPVGLLGWLAATRYLPDFRGEGRVRLDVAGYLLLALSMVMVSLSVDGVHSYGLPVVAAVVMLVSGLACLAAYFVRASRQAQPLFPLGLFRVPSYTIGLLGNLFSRLGSSAMPFLVPLLLQLGMGYSPAQAGMTMLPMALAGMLVKRLATGTITRYGYRTVLVTNTVLLGLLIASFALVPLYQNVWLMLLHLAVFGACNSIQFTAMNALTLHDLDPHQASSGNSLFSMMQMLAMSLGVALAGAVLGAFSDRLQLDGHGEGVVLALQGTYLCMGLMTLASTWIFWQQSPESRLTRRLQRLDVTE